jgi:hypothetical protein
VEYRGDVERGTRKIEDENTNPETDAVNEGLQLVMALRQGCIILTDDEILPLFC